VFHTIGHIAECTRELPLSQNTDQSINEQQKCTLVLLNRMQYVQSQVEEDNRMATHLCQPRNVVVSCVYAPIKEITYTFTSFDILLHADCIHYVLRLAYHPAVPNRCKVHLQQLALCQLHVVCRHPSGRKFGHFVVYLADVPVAEVSVVHDTFDHLLGDFLKNLQFVCT